MGESTVTSPKAFPELGWKCDVVTHLRVCGRLWGQNSFRWVHGMVGPQKPLSVASANTDAPPNSSLGVGLRFDHLLGKSQYINQE